MAPIQVCMGLSANTAISKGHGEFLHNTREKWQERNRWFTVSFSTLQRGHVRLSSFACGWKLSNLALTGNASHAIRHRNVFKRSWIFEDHSLFHCLVERGPVS